MTANKEEESNVTAISATEVDADDAPTTEHDAPTSSSSAPLDKEEDADEGVVGCMPSVIRAPKEQKIYYMVIFSSKFTVDDEYFDFPSFTSILYDICWRKEGA